MGRDYFDCKDGTNCRFPILEEVADGPGGMGFALAITIKTLIKGDKIK